MHLSVISRIIGFFSMGFSATILIPLLVSLIYQDGETDNFLLCFGITLGAGLAFWLPTRSQRTELATRDGFIIVALFWSFISLLASLPFVFSQHMPLTDALFESVSAFTTTGATVMSGLDGMPRSLLFYRQQLQWFGGMGMIVLAVAILPMIGIGGMQLYRAEAPGPLKEEKLTPRLEQTARTLWLLYVGITVANAFAYWLAGMSGFDAIAHAFSTVSTGGFSTHDASLGYFGSPLIEGIAVVFMMLGAINFSIHYIAFRNRDLRAYWRNTEVRTFLLVVLAAITLVTLMLFSSKGYGAFGPDLRNATFEVVSVITSTGYGTVDFSGWPDFLPVFLIFISFIGGCGGSTAGGLKVMRVILLVQMGYREIRRLIHPRALFSVRIDNKVVSSRTIEAVWGFFAMYIVSFGILMLAMIHSGLDQVSAFSAIATCMNNLGPGLGQVTSSFASVSEGGKLIAVVAMLLGRLEVFTILVLLTPEFWRK